MSAKPTSQSLTSTAAADLINRGNVVAFPTETVYGLGADATNPHAVAQIFQLKGRPNFNPLIVHTDSIERLSEAAILPTNSALAQRVQALLPLWPGPLTIVLARQDTIAANVTNGSVLVGLRIPAHRIAQEFLSKCKSPVAAPSANKSNRVSPTSAQHVREEFGGEIAILEGGDSNLGIESTVVEPTDSGLIIHRPGFITHEQLSDLAGPIISKQSKADDSEIVSPGQLAQHYSPTTSFYELSKLPTGLKSVAVLGLGADMARIDSYLPNEWTLIKFNDTIEYAAKLYATLREIDKSKRFEAVAAIFPSRIGLGLAICDRLSRATVR